jgi:hypothetical protein
MNISIAIVDPGMSAGGGVLALCLFVVGPVALVAHGLVRRFVLVSLCVAGAFGLFLLGLWWFLDAGVPARGEASLRLVVVGFVAAVVVSVLAGIPALLARTSRREKPSDGTSPESTRAPRTR